MNRRIYIPSGPLWTQLHFPPFTHGFHKCGGRNATKTLTEWSIDFDWTPYYYKGSNCMCGMPSAENSLCGRLAMR